MLLTKELRMSWETAVKLPPMTRILLCKAVEELLQDAGVIKKNNIEDLIQTRL